MEKQILASILNSLGFTSSLDELNSLTDGRAILLHGASGNRAAVTRQSNLYDFLLIGSDSECPVASLREILDNAVLPMSDDYATSIGIAKPERDLLRKRIREAAVALDVLAKGQKVKVRPADIVVHPQILQLSTQSPESLEASTENLAKDIPFINELQSQVAYWTKEIDRLVQLSRVGPTDLLSAEEEVMFWSSLDAAFAGAQTTLASKPIKICLQVLARKRRATGFMMDVSQALDSGRLRAAGVLNLVQGLPIVNIRTAESEENLLSSVTDFWGHMGKKVRISSLPLERVMSLTDSLSEEVHRRLRDILIDRGGLLKTDFPIFCRLVEASCTVFEAWGSGYDSCRIIAREIATRRGESIPPRRAPAFTPLRNRIEDIFELRSHNAALHTALVKQANSSSTAAGMLDQLDDLYVSVITQSGDETGLDLSEEGTVSWTSSRQNYASCVEDIENFLAMQFQETVANCARLSDMSEFANSFFQLLDRPFMVSSIESCVDKVLRLANHRMAQLKFQWNKPHSLHAEKGCHVNLPYICAEIVQARVIRRAVTSLLADVESILGPARVSNDQNICDFSQDANSFLSGIDESSLLMKWLHTLSHFASYRLRPLISYTSHVKMPVISSGLPWSEIDTLKSLRFFGEDKQLSKRIPQRLLSLYRESVHILQIHELLKSAFSSYFGVWKLLSIVDEFKCKHLFPLIRIQLQSAQESLKRASLACWGNAIVDLFEIAQDCANECQSFSRAFRALVQEHDFIFESLSSLEALHIRQSSAHEMAGQLQQIKAVIDRVRNTLLSMESKCLDKESYEVYLNTCISPALGRAVDGVMERSISSWTDSLIAGELSQMKVSLEVSKNGDGFRVQPELRIAYKNFLRSFQNFVSSLHSRITLSEAGLKTVPIQVCSFLSSPRSFSSHSNVGLAFQKAVSAINNTLSSLRESVGSWDRYAYVLALNADSLLSKAGHTLESSHNLLISLSQVKQELGNSKSKEPSLEPQEISSSYLDASIVHETLHGKLNDILSIVLRSCGSACAAESQSLYSLLHSSKTRVKDCSGKGAVDVVLILRSIEDNVFDHVETKLDMIRDIELCLVQAGKRGLPNDWISFEELSAEFKVLRSVHEQRKRNIMMNHAELEKMYHRERESFNGEVAKINTFVSESWESFDCGSIFDSIDASSSQEKNSISFESVSTSFKHLRETSSRLCSVEKALDLRVKSASTLVETLAAEVERLQSALNKSNSICSTLRDLGSTTFGNFEPKAFRRSLDGIADQVGFLEEYYGESRTTERIKGLVELHKKTHNLLSSLSLSSLSPLRERDVLITLFGDRDSSSSLANKKIQYFWETNILQHESYLRHVFEVAAGESALAEFLLSVRDAWSSKQPNFVRRDGIQLVEGIPGLVDALNEQLEALMAMAGSQYVGLFEEERKLWEVRLSKCRDDLELIGEIQVGWLHIHGLFGSESSSEMNSLRKRLHHEFQLFSDLESQLFAFFRDMSKSAGLVEYLNVVEGLENMLSDLNEILRSLSKFLEDQRSLFPRFFFLSDSDLLLVLSLSPKRFSSLLPSISKLFYGLGSVEFESTGNCGVCVTAVVSSEGERLELMRPVHFANGIAVSDFLFSFDKALKGTLRSLLPTALKNIENLFFSSDGFHSEAFRTTIIKFPSQLILLAFRILFTSQIELMLESSSDELVSFSELLTTRLHDVCSYENSIESSVQLERLLNLKMEHIVKELVYQRDTTRTLMDSSVRTKSAYEWDHQLRFYIKGCDGMGSQESSSDVSVKCANACFGYGWEYVGVGDYLVQTPLTSRCYLALTQALRRGLGGCPFGPAGTGKTETVKSLGRLLGRCVVVFNCDETFDNISVGRILAGVSRVGFWVCFDEFNRLSASSLSSTSQQLSLLQHAVQKGKKEVPNFYGGSIPIEVASGLGIFVTMNPTYTGRRELPSNLKSLFRPCAMSSPDCLVIAEVLLLSYGFAAPKTLGSKLVYLFECSKSVIPHRPHYDFGLRTLKSTITVAGTLRCSFFEEAIPKDCKGSQQQEEEIVVVTALHQVLKPRLIAEDIVKYNAYVCNLFPHGSCHQTGLPVVLHQAVISVCIDRRLSPGDHLIEKIAQLFNLLKHRPAVILVGPTGCGKSVAWRTLFDAMRRVKEAESGVENVEKRFAVTVVNPKLLSASQLYGNLDAATREWTDGLFTKKLRDSALLGDSINGSDSYHWIVFDGDIDPNWVENLNSVLDDTRLLTLPSGERIPFSSNLRLIFEVDNLKHANPSTISRCGLLYFGEPKGINDALRRQLDLLTTKTEIGPIYRDELLALGAAYSSFVAKNGLYTDAILRQPACAAICGFVAFFSASLNRFINCQKALRSEASITNPSESVVNETILESQTNQAVSIDTLVLCFLVAAKDSFGAGISTENKVAQCQELVRCLKGVSGRVDEVLAYIDARKVTQSTFNWQSGALVEDKEQNLDEFALMNLPDDIGSPDIVVPTPSSLKLTRLVGDLIWKEPDTDDNRSIIVLCGPPGCGKSMILSAALTQMTGVHLATISMSSRTTPLDVISMLGAHMDLHKSPNGGFLLAPRPPNKQVVLFCDEVNLAEPDEFDTQNVAGFLRDLIERNGFWSGSPPQWMQVRGLRLVAACNPPTDAGRHELPSRIMRHSIVIHVGEPSRKDLYAIFKVHISGLIRYISPNLKEKANSMTKAMIDFFCQNKERFAPDDTGPLQPHYIYSARELIRWVRGMKHILVSIFRPSSLTMIGAISSAPKDVAWNDIVSIFCHEARRLFMDRLVSKDELKFAESALVDVIRIYFGYSGSLVPDIWFSSWLSRGNTDSVPIEKIVLREVLNVEEFRQKIYQKLRVFAEEEGLGGAWMSGMGAASSDDVIDQFAVTDEVLRHLTRIERILSLPLGHAVLLGVPGTGKKTLARFAAWMTGAIVFQVRSHASYSSSDFASDLRALLRKAGIYSAKVVVIFDESNDLDSAFLEMMNSILACGDVPGLFEGDERASLLREIHENLCTSPSRNERPDALYSKFLDGVRKNFHVIFSVPTRLSSRTSGEMAVQETLSKDLNIRSPALYNRCVVDWFGDWDKETLESIADLKLEVSKGQERDSIVSAAVRIHVVAQKYLASLANDKCCATPRHFLEFIEQLNRVALEKAQGIQKGASRLKEGLEKLREAGDAVQNLNESLLEKKSKLSQKEEEANDTLKQMSEEQRMAEKSKIEAEKLAHAAAEAAKAASLQQEEVTAQLAAVEPKVVAAREAVGSIKKEFLEELRGMPNPPSSVRAALDAVMILLDASSRHSVGKYSWIQVRSRMRSADFIASILNFNTDLLPSSLRQQIEAKILHNPDFDIDRISYASQAAGPLAEWTIAVLDYAAVKDTVAPLREEVEILQKEEEDLVNEKERARADVIELEQRICEYRSQYAVLVSEAERVRGEIIDAEEKLKLAEKMLDSLGEEWERWVTEFKQYNCDADKVWGNAVYASAFVAYAGPLDQAQRKAVCHDWTSVLDEENIEFDKALLFANFLTTSEDRATWTQAGLPMDEASLENYAILMRSARYPLLIDPSDRSSSILHKLLNSDTDGGAKVSSSSVDSERIKTACSKVSTTSFANSDRRAYARAVESAVRFGTNLLIEDTERFDYSVLPLLGQESSFGHSSELVVDRSKSNSTFSRRGIQKRAQQRLVRLGDKDVAISPGFRLFLATSNIANVPVAAVSRSSVVSFALSAAAVKSSCVSRCMSSLFPRIEAQKSSYISSSLKFERRKEELEELLLKEIQNSDDVGIGLLGGSLLKTLHDLKTECMLVAEKEEENRRLAAEGQAYENEFLSLANAGLRLHAILQNLRSVNSLYRFSTAEFFSIFEDALTQAKRNCKSTYPSAHDVHSELLRATYLYCAPSLFPQDKVPFACSLVVGAIRYHEEESGLLTFEEVQGLYSVLCAESETSMCSSLRRFQQNFEMGNDFRETSSKKQEYLVLENIIGVVLNTFSPENKLMVPSLLNKLGSFLPGGETTVHSPLSRADEVLRSTIKSMDPSDAMKGATGKLYIPLLIYSRGSNSDPCELVSNFASKYSVSIESFAMSNECTPQYLSEIFIAAKRRSRDEIFILLLKNIHLASQACAEHLKKEVSIDLRGFPFLLIMASEAGQNSSQNFLDLLSICRVLAFETPPSFRTNLSRCHAVLSLNVEDFARRAYIAVTWLHGSLLERSQFIPVGFSRPYSFTDNDLLIAWDVVQQYCKSDSSQTKQNVQSMVNLLLCSVYGCRLENQHDFAVLEEYANDLFARVLVSNESTTSARVVDELFCDNAPVISINDPYMEAVPGNLPLSAPTEWFGMPAQVGKDFSKHEGQTMLNIFRSMVRPRSALVPITKSESNPRDRGDRTVEIVEELIERLTKTLKTSSQRLEAGADSKDMEFFEQEKTICADCITQLRDDLACTLSVLKGSTRETSKTSEIRWSIVRFGLKDPGSIPSAWRKIASYAGAPNSVGGLIETISSSYEWLVARQAGSKIIDMRFVLRPKAMFAALSLFEAERLDVSVNTLAPVLKGPDSAGHGNFWTLKGLYIEGGTWDSEKAHFTSPNEFRNAFPLCHVFFTSDNGDQNDTHATKASLVKLPMYSDSSRNELVTSIFAPVDSSIAPSRWRLSSSAIIVGGDSYHQ